LFFIGRPAPVGAMFADAIISNAPRKRHRDPAPIAIVDDDLGGVE